MGQVARPPSRTASDSERIQALVARHSQSWSSPASGSRLRVRVTQPPRSKSSVQEGSAHKSARGRSKSVPRPAVAQPIRVTDSPYRTMKRQPQCGPPRRGGASTGAAPKGGSTMLPRDPRKFLRDLNPPPIWEKEATVPRETARPREFTGGQRSDHVMPRLNLPWSISALFSATALLLGMQIPRARAFTAYDCSN